MAKDKSKAGVPNKHIHARVTFLQQAATYLTVQGKQSAAKNSEPERCTSKPDEGVSADSAVQTQSPGLSSGARLFGGLPQYLTNHLTQVARKSQIRLHSNVKHSICKRCGNTLIDGTTSTKAVENLSKGGKKPHADVLIVKCGFCGAQRRSPVGAQRQKKKSQRRTGGQDDAMKECEDQAAEES